MNFTYDTCYSVVDCTHEYRINLFNKRPKIKINRSVGLLQSDDDGEVVFNSESERVALRRAKVAVVDLAMCNDFEYFGTITLDEKKVGDLLNYPQKMKDWITKVFDNYRNQVSPNFRYILIAEYGKCTKRLHFHYVCKGIRKDDLFYNSHRKLDWHLTSDRFGFTQITRIKGNTLDRVRVAKYCAKYLSKDSLKICKHRYFASKDLNRPERSIFECDDEAVFVSEWLEFHGFNAYANMEYALCYCIPKKVYEDLMKAVEEWKKPPKPYLIDLPDWVLSPWDFGFNPKQISYKELLA